MAHGGNPQRGVAPALPAVRNALRTLLDQSSAAIDSPYAVTAVVFGAAVEATLEADGASFVLQITPATTGRCYRRTDRFNISYRGKTLDRLAYAVVDAACAAIAAWDRSLAAGAEALLFTEPTPPQDGSRLELLAVGGDVKPTCRIVVAPQAGEEVVAAARRLGLHACRVDAYASSPEGRAHLQRTTATKLVLAARTAAELSALAEAEERGAGPAEIGALLGYPRCCVDAFIAHNEDPKPALRFAALQRTGATSSYLLNDIDGKVGLVSHLVCRYDCTPSTEIADGVLRAFARQEPEKAEAFAASLRGLMVAFKDGGTLRLEVESDAALRRRRIAAVHAIGDGPTIWGWREALIGADAVDVHDGWLCAMAGQRELQRLEAPADRVQIRMFA